MRTRGCAAILRVPGSLDMALLPAGKGLAGLCRMLSPGQSSGSGVQGRMQIMQSVVRSKLLHSLR